MGDMSRLSPVDPQIMHESGLRIAAKSPFRVLQKLNRVFKTQDENEVPYPAKFMVESLDPVMIEESAGIIQMTSEYLDRILKVNYDEHDLNTIIDWLIYNL